MNSITGFQRAIDYVEEHIGEEIDYEAVAARAYLSSFHFQRLFTLLVGIPLGEYIRRRRLTLAGEQLVKERRKVIDVALDFGYDAPESFSRAFAAFHGISPTEAKRGGVLKFYPKISVKLILNGGNIMNYRIETLGAFRVVCKRKEFLKQQELTTKEISDFWAKCTKDGVIQKAVSLMPKSPNLKGALGISFTGQGDDTRFPYGIGAEYGGGDAAGLEVIEIPAYTYAVFPTKGKMPEAFVTTYRKICTEFFPQSGYSYGNGVEFEVYPSPEADRDDYTAEIWIAIK